MNLFSLSWQGSLGFDGGRDPGLGASVAVCYMCGFVVSATLQGVNFPLEGSWKAIPVYPSAALDLSRMHSCS